MKAHELFLFAIDTIKGEYPESQWPDYHVAEMERAAAVLPQLVDNVQTLLKLNAEREKTVRKMIRLTLAHLSDPRHHPQQRKQLIQSLEEYVNEDK
jgi:hypothetical protein